MLLAVKYMGLAVLFLVVVAGTAGIYLGLRAATSTHHLSCPPAVAGFRDPLAQKGCPQNP